MVLALEKLDICVLCGGRGGEREVSLVSGAEVNRGLLEAGLKSRLLELSPECTELNDLQCDIAFLALHGEFGEDGQVQQILEQKAIPYTGSGVDASALTMDKFDSKQRVSESGVPVADSVCADNFETLIREYRKSKLGLPVVVKPNNGGSSVGVTIVRDAKQLDDAIKAAFACGKKVMIEKFLKGREVTVGVVGGKAMPLVEMCPAGEFYDYHAKYNDDRTVYVCPAKCSNELTLLCQKFAVDSFNALGLRGFARIDFILTDCRCWLRLRRSLIFLLFAGLICLRVIQYLGLLRIACCQKLHQLMVLVSLNCAG